MSFKKLFNVDFFLHSPLIFKPHNVIPDYFINHILELDAVLENERLKGLVFDIDQTIIPFRHNKIEKEISRYLHVLSTKYTCCLLSNVPPLAKRIQRVKNIEQQVGIKAVFPDKRKPSPQAFKKALDSLKLTPQETGMIGDRIFTDIIGAKHMGMKTVLVKPLLKKTDPLFFVTLPRFFEEMYLKLVRFCR